ncbi:hypothetical protein Tco_1572197, partial [Tanacetum coccineum]
HTTLTCKVRPRTEEELAAKEAKVGNINDQYKRRVKKGNVDVDCFVTVGDRQRKVGNNYKFVNIGNKKSSVNRSSNGENQHKVHPKDRNNRPMNKESVPIKNSFQALVDEEMEQCCREDDINVQTEMDWTIHQMDYFYKKNYHKYQLDPSYEDEDVESKVDGIAGEIKPEYDVAARDKSNFAAPSTIVFNGVSSCCLEC